MDAADPGHRARRASRSFTIAINFQGDVTPATRAVFNAAKATWESLLTGYDSGISASIATINAAIVPIDGPGNILGQVGLFGIWSG